jgi:hypothetical protein
VKVECRPGRHPRLGRVGRRDDKKLVKARELAQAYIARLDKGESLPDAAKAMGFPNRQFGPFLRVQPPIQSGQVVGTAFALKPGQHSSAIETPQAST